MMTPLAIEEAWLETLRTSKLMGICIIDEDGSPVQRYCDDPELREAVLDYQLVKVCQLRLSERASDGQRELTPYPQRDE